MTAEPSTFALLPKHRPWAAYALASAEAGLEIGPSSEAPEALLVLQSAKRIAFKVDGDGLMAPGSWEHSLGPPGHPLAEGFDPARCWTVAHDHSSWALVARWGDDPAAAELWQVWIRDELDHQSLGRLDRSLDALVFAIVAPEDDELVVKLDQPSQHAALVALLNAAAPLRQAERERVAAELQRIEGLVDAGDETPEILEAWEAAQHRLEELGVVSWERLASN